MDEIVRIDSRQTYVISVGADKAELIERLYKTLESAQYAIVRANGDVKPVVGFMQVLETLAEIAGKELYYGGLFGRKLTPETGKLPEGTTITTGRFLGDEVFNGTQILNAEEIRRRFEALVEATRHDPTVAKAVADAFGISFQEPEQGAPGTNAIELRAAAQKSRIIKLLP